jgi:hypothetical protein
VEKLLSTYTIYTPIVEWGSVTPKELKCPSLWLTGAEDKGSLVSLELYKEELK